MKKRPSAQFGEYTMSSDFKGWSNLPKSVKLLDISIISYGILLIISISLYFFILDQTVQNLMPIFLVAILLIFTWNFRSQLLSLSKQEVQKRHFREWLIISTIIILLFVLLILIYPVTYQQYNYSRQLNLRLVYLFSR